MATSSWGNVGLGGARRTTSNGPEALALVTNECGKLLYAKPKGARYDLQCCYHISSDGFSRTLNVNLNPNRVNSKGFQVPIGWYYCWSCGASGPWNKLAETLNLEKLVEPDNPNIQSGLVDFHWEDEYAKPDDSMLFPITGDWEHRDCTIKYKTLMKFGVKEYLKIVNQGGEYVMYRKLWLPAIMNRRLVGHVEIRLDEEDPEPKYKNSAGAWSATNWVGFDTIREYFPRDYVCIVEGSADAMRLVQNRIPAMPLLGVQSWSSSKRIAVTQAFDHVFVIGDGDEAGERMRKQLCLDMEDSHPIILEDGMDPAKLEREDIRELKSVIARKLRRRT